jgi:putative flippase GtrA
MRLPGDSTVYRFILVGIVNTLFGTAIMFVFYNVFHLSYWLSSASTISASASSPLKRNRKN